MVSGHDDTLESLRGAGVPEPLLRKLDALKEKHLQPFKTEKLFLAELEEVFTQDELKQRFGDQELKDLLLKHAGMPDPWRWLMLPACTLGALLADILLYGIGRVFGELLKRVPILSRLASPEKQERIRENLHRYGVAIFVIGRLIPGLRSTLFLTAGTTRLALWKFCLADGIGGLIGTSLFFFLGYILGDQFKALIKNWDDALTPYKTVILILLLSVAGAYLIRRYLRQPIPTGDPEEVPLIGHQIATHLPTSPPDNTPSPQPASEAIGSAPSAQEHSP